jgi:hypothetical protein
MNHLGDRREALAREGNVVYGRGNQSKYTWQAGLIEGVIEVDMHEEDMRCQQCDFVSSMAQSGDKGTSRPGLPTRWTQFGGSPDLSARVPRNCARLRTSL